MSATVVRLSRVFRRSWDWSQQELAEFYRVESALIQAGLKIEIERGLSDEGDPWFAFCRPDNGEVIVHIARIEGVYFLASPSYEGIACGRSIAELVGDLVSRHPLIQMRGDHRRRGPNILLHPAAMLIAVVATAFFKSAEARAATDDPRSGDGRNAGGARSDTASVMEGHKTVVMEAALGALILYAVTAVLQVAQQDFVSEPDLGAAADAELVDLAVLSPPAPNSVSMRSVPAAHSAPAALGGFQAQEVQSVKVVDASAHGLPAAMPLVALLWDLPVQSVAQSEQTTVPDDGGNAAGAVSVGGIIGPLLLHPALLTFEMAGAGDETGDLPAVESVKVSYTNADGDLETNLISQPHELPAALVGALQAAAHAPIEGQPLGFSEGSFASTLIHLVTKQNTADTNENTADTLVDPSESSSGTALSSVGSDTASVSDSASTGSATALPESAASKSPLPPNAEDVSAAIQDFLENTPHWKSFNNGNGIVVYDVDALTGHPDALKSVTFDFSDGSTLSLVGLATALPDWLIV